MSDWTDKIVKQVRTVAQDHSEKLVLDVARKVKAEMGPEAASISFRFKKASRFDLQHHDSLGSLRVEGPDGVKERFVELVKRRMR